MASRAGTLIRSYTAGGGPLTSPVREPQSNYSTRPHVFLKPKEPIVCPQLLAGEYHLLKPNVRGFTYLQYGLIRCTHRVSNNQGQCGAHVFVLAMTGGWHYAALATPAEVRYMEQEKMSAEESMAYLLTGKLFTTQQPLAGTQPR